MQRETEWEWTDGVYYLESIREFNVFEKRIVLLLLTSSLTLNMFYLLKLFFDAKTEKFFDDSKLKI